MKAILSIDREEARMVIEGIITFIREFETEDFVNKEEVSKSPVVVSVVNPYGAEPRQDVMDGAVPVASESLAHKRAILAATNGEDGTFRGELSDNLKKEKLQWGSAVLKAHDKLVGAVGVSGRNVRKTTNGYRQDQELAELGADIFKVYSGYSKKMKEAKSRNLLIRETLEEIVQ